jgi:hypothetical protein
MQELDDRMIFFGLEEASRAFDALGIPKGHLDAYIEAGGHRTVARDFGCGSLEPYINHFL